jgi:hypothetical protein
MVEKKDEKIKPGEAKLVDRAIAIREQDIFERNNLGFSTRVVVQCSLPHRDPGNSLQVWTRTNGDLCLSIQPQWYKKDEKMICTGYPCHIPSAKADGLQFQ